MSQKLSFAAVVICALRVKPNHTNSAFAKLKKKDNESTLGSLSACQRNAIQMGFGRRDDSGPHFVCVDTLHTSHDRETAAY